MRDDNGQWQQQLDQQSQEAYMEKLEGLKTLRQPFPPHQIGQMCRSTKKENPKGRCPKCGGYHGLPAVQLTYIGHAAITDRLLEVDPEWTWEPMAVDAHGAPVFDKNGGIWIKLTVLGVTRPGYGDAQTRQGGDGVKEAIGDALRNAAMRFGCGLDLWHKGDLHLDEEDDGVIEEPAAPPAGKLDTLAYVEYGGAINKAATLPLLKTAFAAAYKACKAVGDEETLADLTQQKELRKAFIEGVQRDEQARADQEYVPQ